MEKRKLKIRAPLISIWPILKLRTQRSTNGLVVTHKPSRSNPDFKNWHARNLRPRWFVIWPSACKAISDNFSLMYIPAPSTRCISHHYFFIVSIFFSFLWWGLGFPTCSMPSLRGRMPWNLGKQDSHTCSCHWNNAKGSHLPYNPILKLFSLSVVGSDTWRSWANYS